MIFSIDFSLTCKAKMLVDSDDLFGVIGNIVFRGSGVGWSQEPCYKPLYCSGWFIAPTGIRRYIYAILFLLITAQVSDLVKLIITCVCFGKIYLDWDLICVTYMQASIAEKRIRLWGGHTENDADNKKWTKALKHGTAEIEHFSIWK